MCCGGACVNLQNDPFNCGKCGDALRRHARRTAVTGRASAAVRGERQLCIADADLLRKQLLRPGHDLLRGAGADSRAPSCYTPTADQPTCPQGCAPLCRSDRNQKKNIAPADTEQILDKVARLPISTWTYVEEPNDVRHLGPMAQDFHASFGLGSDDRTYNSVDAHGVAMAAIQELEKVVAAQERRIEKLERENRRLERRLRAPPASGRTDERR